MAVCSRKAAAAAKQNYVSEPKRKKQKKTKIQIKINWTFTFHPLTSNQQPTLQTLSENVVSSKNI